jgi:hypothetical protein
MLRRRIFEVNGADLNLGKLGNCQFSPAVEIAVLAILDLNSKSEYPQDLKGPE